MTVVRRHLLLLKGLLLFSAYAVSKEKQRPAHLDQMALEDNDWEQIEKNHGLNNFDHITPEMMHTLHKAFDSDGDGKATKDEISKYADTMRGVLATKDSLAGMSELDDNNDGKLTLD